MVHYDLISSIPAEPQDWDQELVHLRRDAASWCAARADVNDPDESLRSLKPPPPLWWPHDQVQVLAARRREQLEHAPEPELSGRLLICFPSDTLEDFGSCSASRGFFDKQDLPPWDTWVAYFSFIMGSGPRDACLISWVPTDLLQWAQHGIDQNTSECVDWLEGPFTISNIHRQMRPVGQRPLA